MRPVVERRVRRLGVFGEQREALFELLRRLRLQRADRLGEARNWSAGSGRSCPRRNPPEPTGTPGIASGRCACPASALSDAKYSKVLILRDRHRSCASFAASSFFFRSNSAMSARLAASSTRRRAAHRLIEERQEHAPVRRPTGKAPPRRVAAGTARGAPRPRATSATADAAEARGAPPRRWRPPVGGRVAARERRLVRHEVHPAAGDVRAADHRAFRVDQRRGDAEQNLLFLSSGDKSRSAGGSDTANNETDRRADAEERRARVSRIARPRRSRSPSRTRPPWPGAARLRAFTASPSRAVTAPRHPRHPRRPPRWSPTACRGL